MSSNLILENHVKKFTLLLDNNKYLHIISYKFCDNCIYFILQYINLPTNVTIELRSDFLTFCILSMVSCISYDNTETSINDIINMINIKFKNEKISNIS